MKSRQKWIISLIMCGLILFLMPALPAMAKEIKVSTTQGDLRAAVKTASDGDIIVLDRDAMVNDDNSKSEPWVIDKNVTIKGGNLELRAGGIVLGANVTFEGVTLSFPNSDRNVIAANGYTLTLTDTSYHTSAHAVHLFCGTMYAENGKIFSTTIPEPGSHGKVIVTSSTAVKMGNIYAGSLSADGTYGTDAIPATIEVNVAKNSTIGLAYGNSKAGIYACGALQTPGAGISFDTSRVQQPPVPTTDYAVTEPVKIKLTGSAVKNVEGATGGENNAEVIFAGGQDIVTGVTLSDVSSLSVESGKFAPSADSDLSDTDIQLSGAARLGFEYMSNPTIKSLAASQEGTIVLGRSQKLMITGGVSGEAMVSINEYNADASSYPTLKHEYIEAKSSTKNSFTLWPYSGVNYALTNTDGIWMAEIGEDPVLLTRIYIAGAEAYSDEPGVKIPVSVGYVNDTDYLWSVPAKITVNNIKMTRETGDLKNYSYVSPDSTMEMFFDFDNDISDCLRIYGEGDEGELAAGEYKISIEIPWANMKNGEEKIINFTLTIKDRISVLPLTFEDKDAYDIPSAVVGTEIEDIDVSKGVSGGQIPYRFEAKGLPEGLSISEGGIISGTLTKATEAGTATITVIDAIEDKVSITIEIGAVTAKTEESEQPGTDETGKTEQPETGESGESEQPESGNNGQEQPEGENDGQEKPETGETGKTEQPESGESEGTEQPGIQEGISWRELRAVWRKQAKQYLIQKQESRQQIRQEHDQRQREQQEKYQIIW
ncbi:MAG: putative Ig domain-containing protein [Lachnospiraceae bacterium]|nr:putative Ig domain-containing protein [Lachnospiraceae bacterium]